MNAFDAGKRGPRPGDGGRPKQHITDDPDRFVIAAALWLRWHRQGNPESVASELKMLDLLFERHADGILIDMDIETSRLRVGAVNTSGVRAEGDSRESGRSDVSSPGNGRFWRSRIDALRRKLKRYWPLLDPKRKVRKSDRLSEDDMAASMWLVRSFGAIDQLLSEHPDAPFLAQQMFSALGWNALPQATASRFEALSKWASQAFNLKA